MDFVAASLHARRALGKPTRRLVARSLSDPAGGLRVVGGFASGPASNLYQNMRSLTYICQVECCDAPAVSKSGHLTCGAHYHRIPGWRRKELFAAKMREDWPQLEDLQRLAVAEVDALEAVLA